LDPKSIPQQGASRERKNSVTGGSRSFSTCSAENIVMHSYYRDTAVTALCASPHCICCLFGFRSAALFFVLAGWTLGHRSTAVAKKPPRITPAGVFTGRMPILSIANQPTRRHCLSAGNDVKK